MHWLLNWSALRWARGAFLAVSMVVAGLNVSHTEPWWRNGVNEAHRQFGPSTNAEESVVISFVDPAIARLIRRPAYVSPRPAKPLKPADQKKLAKAASDYFTADAQRRAVWQFPSGLDRLVKQNEPAARQAVWEAYRSAPIHGPMKEDFATNSVRFGPHLSAYTVKPVGAKPAAGWPLFIAMHGGGNAPKRVNDSQWKVMQGYYRDHPEIGGYLYVALRAPNDTWNGFYDDYVYPLIANLIQQFALFGDVDVNKTFIMGYSHGGYGAFAIGPKMPDHFAAIHASAGAPTDGETVAHTLRNTVFTYMIGEKDTAYGRIDRCRKFNDTVEALRSGRDDIYPVQMQFIAGNGHTGLPDRDKIVEMYPAVRNPVPRELTWLMTDKVIRNFFWLGTASPGKEQEIKASCRSNKVVLTGSKVAKASLYLDARLIDLDQPVSLTVNGRALPPQKVKPRLGTLCRTMLDRTDPELTFSVEIPIEF